MKKLLQNNDLAPDFSTKSKRRDLLKLTFENFHIFVKKNRVQLAEFLKAKEDNIFPELKNEELFKGNNAPKRLKYIRKKDCRRGFVCLKDFYNILEK